MSNNEELGEQLRITQKAYYEVEDENKAIREELKRLQGCLDCREQQLFALTGKEPEEEEF